MAFYAQNLETLTRQNKVYRRVIYTSPTMQLVLQRLPSGHNLGKEVHHGVSQFFRVEQGSGVAIVGKNTFQLRRDSAFVVPAGTPHDVWAAGGGRPLKFYTVYSAPVHEDEEVDRTAADEKRPARTTKDMA